MCNSLEEMIQESDELRIRIEKLKDFVADEIFDTLENVSRIYVREQLRHMEYYHTTLLCRICREHHRIKSVTTTTQYYPDTSNDTNYRELI